MSGYTEVLSALRTTFRAGKTMPVSFRKEQLKKLHDLIAENEEKICQAVEKDIRKNKSEVVSMETLFTLNEVNSAIAELDSWAKPTKVSKNLLQMLDRAYIQKDPLGVVLIIGAWNYPIQLTLVPLLSAIAAGNCAILKPSEIAENSAAVLAELIPKYLDQDAVRVVLGGVTETTELLALRFDHIFYTGSTAVGKVVAAAAAKHLTPVTLELGGKSPVIVDKDVDLSVAGRRIAWGRFLNCGQSCIAPDYVLCDASVRQPLIDAIWSAVGEFYGDDAAKSADYARFPTDRHFDRIANLLQSTKGKVVYGGRQDKVDRYIEPTILDEVTFDDPIMKEEIFGPVLPIVTMESAESAIEFITQNEKPLALYLFSNDQKFIDLFTTHTSSGNVCINDTMMHVGLDSLPFGGVGHSGMGRYHGKFGFDTFTHEKGVLHRGLGMEKLLWMRYPPYDEKKLGWVKTLLVKRRLPFM